MPSATLNLKRICKIIREGKNTYRVVINIITDFYHLSLFLTQLISLSMPHNSKDAFKVIFEACEEGIIVANDQGVIVLANHAGHQMFGYSNGSLIGKKIEDLKHNCLI